MVERLFLEYSKDKLQQLTGRIESCLDRLDEDQVWRRQADVQNAIGNLVLHLSGNVRQWIISGVGGAADTRRRDAEFAARGGSGIDDLKRDLRQTITEAVAVIESLQPEKLVERRQIQRYDLSVLEAIYHVVEHFSHHTGQIIFATKLMKPEDLGFYRHLNTSGGAGQGSPP
jgi:uncharacterized damage-inducible protein DinB